MNKLLPDNWAEIRQVVLKRDGHKCTVCDITGSLDVHHIHPKFFGGSHDPQNLISLCRKCHTDQHIDLQIKLGSSAMIKIAAFLKKLIGKFKNQPLSDLKYILLLKQLTGQTHFLPGQEEIINAVLKGKDVLVIKPTGWGKSLCFQLPAIVADKQTLVISPLKALMRDQVQSLQKRWIPATFLNSDLSSFEINGRVIYLQKNLFKLFYCAPERFQSSDGVLSDHAQKLLDIPISLFVVDEAHCIIKWGKSFRPEYGKLQQIKKKYKSPQTLAFTATANKREQEEIIANLEMKKPAIFVQGFNRANISLKVINFNKRSRKWQPSLNDYQSKLNFLNGTLFQLSGKILIFVPTIKTGQKLKEDLSDQHSVELYYAGLNPIIKSNIQDRYSGKLSPEIDILISTSAFSMGVDIPNIRYIIHWTQPSSISNYFQEFGRAGRDGKPALAMLLKSPGDESIHEFLNEKSTEEILPIADRNKVRFKLKEDLDDIKTYVGSSDCRRGKLLKYFGEEIRKKSFLRKVWDFILRRKYYCCDNCTKSEKKYYKLIDKINLS